MTFRDLCLGSILAFATLGQGVSAQVEPPDARLSTVADTGAVAQRGVGSRPLVEFAGSRKSAGGARERGASVVAEIESRGLHADGQFAVLNARALLTASEGQRFTFSAPDRAPATFRTVAVVASAAGGSTWIGIHDADERGGAQRAARYAYVSVVDGAVSGFLDTHESRFEIFDFSRRSPSNQGEAATVYVLDYAALGLSRAIHLGNDAIAPPPLAERPLWMQEEARAARALSATRDDAKAAPAPQSTIDVLVAYTSGMVTRYGSTAGVVARINTVIQFANNAYVASEVAITLSLVHTVEVTYSNSGSNGTALNELTGSNGSQPVVIPASLSGIAALRNTYGADLVVLMRPYERTTHAGCGNGWIGGYNVTNISDDAPFGHSTVSDGSDIGGSGFFCSTSTLAHELGHNMGLMHNRADAGGELGATLYAYGYSIPATTNGDIMSYAPGEAAVFSSPNLLCVGTACAIGGAGSAIGVTANTPVEACISTVGGCNANQASGCTANPTTCADAARALNFTRVKVSQFRATAAPAPTISGSAQLSGGGSVANGTAVCANPSAGVVCGNVSGGNFSCTVPSGWTGTLHLQAGNTRRVAARVFSAAVTTAQSNQNFVAYNANVAALPMSFICNPDIDNNGLNDAATDGVMILRRLLGVTGDAQAVSGSGVCAQRTSASERAAFLNAQDFSLSGVAGSARATRDGLILMRLMLGIPGATAVAETELSWPTVQSELLSKCGLSF